MSLFSRLRERKVVRMVIIYFVLAWSSLQVVDIATGLLYLPDWTLRAAFAAAGVGVAVGSGVVLRLSTSSAFRVVGLVGCCADI